MSVKQIPVFLENKEGRLAEVTRVMGENHIDISALSIADTTNFGILRMIVNDPVKAETVLKDHGYAVRIASVLRALVVLEVKKMDVAKKLLSDAGVCIFENEEVYKL